MRRLADRLTDGAPLYPLAVLFGLNAVDELDRATFGVLAPEIRDHFDLDIQGILTVISLVGVAVLVVEVPIAYLADRRQRVPITVGGAAVWGMFSLFTGLAPTLLLLAVARAGSGLGQAVVRPTHNSLLADYYDIDVRAKVYGIHRGANSLGLFLGPAIGGLLAYFFGWRLPFIVFAVPTLVFVLLALRLREPIRGGHERRAMGADEQIVATEEDPPSFAEGWRALWQIGVLRRIWYAVPFYALAFIGLGALLSIFYEQEFGLNEAERGFLFAFAEPGQLVALALGVPIAHRLVNRDPALVMRLLAVAGVVISALWLVLAVSPTLWVAVTMHVLLTGVAALLVPGIYTLLSLAIPPRIRSLGFTVVSLWVLPGVMLVIVLGAFADAHGVRVALALMAPIFLTGSLIVATGASFVNADIQRVRAAAVAQSEVRAARDRGEAKLLLVRQLDVAYDGVQVLFGVDFEVDEGEIVALLGTNGAGKSTLLRAISGLVEPAGGAIVFDGRDMTFTPPHESVSRGVVQVPGGKGVFPSLSVAENLRLAGWMFRDDPDHVARATEEVLEHFPVLRERWAQQAGNLSGGEQQMLTLGMAFIAQPRLLMIDELSLGLAPVIVDQLLGIVGAIRDQGTTIVLVEQSVNVALTVAETAYFMEKGEIRFQGATAELLERDDILRSVFLQGASAGLERSGQHGARSPAGESASTEATPSRTAPPAGSRPLLMVDDVAIAYGGIRAVDGVSLELARGQILGIIGPNGAGKTTLFDLISGFVVPDQGRIDLNGIDVTGLPAEVRAQLGLGRSFQDARLFPGLTVGETIAVALERAVEIRDPVAALLGTAALARSEAAVQRQVDELVEVMGLMAFRDKFVSELSTGSRRIVDLACVMAHKPSVLLFDEPSSGIAQRETEALGPLLGRIRDETGTSLLVIEHDMPLICGLADEIIALDLGRVITRDLPEAVIEHPAVISSYLGTNQDVIARSGEGAS